MKIEARLPRKNGASWIGLRNWDKTRWALVGMCLTAVLLASFATVPTMSDVFPHGRLIADANQSLAIIGDDHADPYYHGGGWVESLDEEAE